MDKTEHSLFLKSYDIDLIKKASSQLKLKLQMCECAVQSIIINKFKYFHTIGFDILCNYIRPI